MLSRFDEHCRWPAAVLAAAVYLVSPASPALAQASPPAVGEAPAAARYRPDISTIDSRIDQLVTQRNIPGAVVGIVDRDGLIWAKAYGYADLGARVRATVDTRYQIGSVTKVFTATLILKLRDRGQLGLDDPVSKWLQPGARTPGALPGGRPYISIRDLLTHTSGLPRDPVNRVDLDGVMQPYSLAALYDGLRTTELNSPTGVVADYSNLGFGLLGHIAERVAGRPYEQALSEEVLLPLGMENTSVTLTPAQEARLARAYWFADQARAPQKRWAFGEISGFGGLTSTVPDLARFVAFQMRAGNDETGPLSAASRAEMQRPQADWQASLQFGFAWQILHHRGLGDVITHGGEVDGYSSYVAFSPALGVGVIVLTNLGGPTSGELGDRVLATVVSDARNQAPATPDRAVDLYRRGDWANAAWAYGKLARQAPTDGQAQYRLGMSLYNIDRFDAALPALEAARANGYDAGTVLYAIGRVHAVRGDRDLAFASLTAAAEAGFRSIYALEIAPEFQQLRADSRWEPLIDRMAKN